MAYYMQNTPETDRRLNSGQSRTPGAGQFDPGDHDDPLSTIFNRIGSFTGAWDPIRSRASNEAAGKVQRRPRRAGTPGGQMQGGDPYTANPWGVSMYELNRNPGKYNQGQNFAAYEGRRYLGGYSDDYVSQTTVPVPYGSDNLSLRYHATQGRARPVYGKPVYREGDESNFAARKTVDQIRNWQAFFQAMGFKTGYAGIWSQFEQDAMRHFMTMANGVPGGGMTVDVLRQRVEADVTSGVLAPGELAGALGSSNLNPLGEDVTGGEGAGSAEMMPYTQTTTETQYQEMSPDQGVMALRQSWLEEYGRNPSQDELSRYVKAVNAAFRADPTIITTVMNVDPMAGTTDTTATTEASGVDPSGMALTESEEDNPERSEYQSNRYFSALMQELGV